MVLDNNGNETRWNFTLLYPSRKLRLTRRWMANVETKQVKVQMIVVEEEEEMK